MTELIVMLGNKIVITVLKWSDSHNEGEKESFIWEVQTLGSICILKDDQNICWYMNTCQTHFFKNGFLLFSDKTSTVFGLAQTIIMGIAQGVT